MSILTSQEEKLVEGRDICTDTSEMNYGGEDVKSMIRVM